MPMNLYRFNEPAMEKSYFALMYDRRAMCTMRTLLRRGNGRCALCRRQSDDETDDENNETQISSKQTHAAQILNTFFIVDCNILQSAVCLPQRSLGR